jgi:hypothetical protein
MYVYIVLLKGRIRDWSTVCGVFSSYKDAEEFCKSEAIQRKVLEFNADWDIEEHMMGVRL